MTLKLIYQVRKHWKAHLKNAFAYMFRALNTSIFSKISAAGHQGPSGHARSRA